MFTFKKIGTGVKDELLTEIEEKVEIEQLKKKEYFSRYKGIFKNLQDAERSKLENGELEYVGGFDSSSLFGAAVGLL